MWRLLGLLCLIPILGCSPTEPSEGCRPGECHTVSAFVYYDENGNGVPDAVEIARVPGVRLTLLGLTTSGTSQPGSGEALIPSVPAGEHTIVASRGTLPPFFQSPTGVLVRVPQAAPVFFPLTLPIGDNVPHRYMAIGDSITDGQGSSDNSGYRALLAQKLREHFGACEIINEGGGTTSLEGASNITGYLARWQPAYTLIMYGTNDWHDRDLCRFPCYTVDRLRDMIHSAQAVHSLPFVATIPPANPADPRSPPERNDWVTQMNVLVAQMAAAEGAVLVDVNTAMLSAGDLPQLFADHVHPNDDGYEIIADAFFKAITGISSSN